MGYPKRKDTMHIRGHAFGHFHVEPMFSPPGLTEGQCTAKSDCIRYVVRTGDILTDMNAVRGKFGICYGNIKPPVTTKPPTANPGGNTGSDKCVADGTGEPCIFPFNFYGRTWNKCKQWNCNNANCDNYGRAWCATAVNSAGDMTSWKDCDKKACKDYISKDCLSSKGFPCIFPFNYKGQTFNKCTLFDSKDNKAWCAVAVNENGDMTSFGNCIMASCEDKCVADGTGEPCIFPFNFYGRTWNKCKQWNCNNANCDNYGRAWCATAVNSAGDMTSWKDCDKKACKDYISKDCLSSKGFPCIFPFNYKGQTFNKCTLFDSKDNKAWCAVAVNENGDMTSFGNCIMASRED